MREAQGVTTTHSPRWEPQLCLGAGGWGEHVGNMLALRNGDRAEPPMQGGLLTLVRLGEKLVSAGFL